MTREQQRARDAAIRVQEALETLDKQIGRYDTLARALPVWIRTNGLLQTVAFLESKASAKTGRPEQVLLSDLALQLGAAGLTRPDGPLSAALVELPYAEYGRWQEEAVRCAAWLKRFAAALVPDDGADPEPDQPGE